MLSPSTCRPLAALLIAVVVVGCAPGAQTGPSPVPRAVAPQSTPAPTPTARPLVTKDAREIVLTLEDVPAGFIVNEERPATGLHPGDRSHHTRDLISPAATRGILRVVATAGVHETEIRGTTVFAHQTTQRRQEAAARGEEELPLDVPLGDRSLAFTRVAIQHEERADGLHIFGFRFITVYWRSGNVTNLLTIAGLDDQVTLADAVELARRQLARAHQ